MRKESRKTHDVNVAEVSGYHRGNHENHLVFASDRPINADRTYHLEDGSLPSMYGLEVETQNWGISNQKIYANVLRSICFQTFHKDLWKIEEDGSLRGNSDSSAECISQPMTKAYIRNHYRDFKAMYEWFNNLGISCDGTGDCGMHVHISNTCFGREKKTQEEAIKKFIYIINKHYDLMRTAVYRRLDNDGSTFYFARMNIEGIKNCDLSYFPNNHHACINIGHYDEGNIELRLVGGQKNFPCFRNTMEVVFHLVEASKRISWKDCDDIVKIFSGCNQYVYDRLKTFVHDANLISDYDLNSIFTSVKREQLL